MMRMDAYVIPTKDTNYSCHIKAIELIQPIIWIHITPLVINSLGGRHTSTHTCIQTFVDRSNSKKPGVHQPVANAHLV